MTLVWSRTRESCVNPDQSLKFDDTGIHAVPLTIYYMNLYDFFLFVFTEHPVSPRGRDHVYVRPTRLERVHQHHSGHRDLRTHIWMNPSMEGSELKYFCSNN